ncbi:MAG TPA: single-stranded DNA-binding protein [Marmoricola sp.]|nr:single-stranded DNA-binding protein [Marmoricola sp.]
MNDSYVTLQGWVGNEVETREAGGATCATFRVGCTPRYYKEGEWKDGQTSWYTVNCWRTLGRNVAESVRKGDAVVVHGRVRVDVWEREDRTKSVTWVVDAQQVGHDLTKGTSTFLKGSSAQPDPTQDQGVKELLHSYDVDGPQLDSSGGSVTPAA